MNPDRSSRYLQPDIETMPREALEQLQERRLLEQVGYAYERSALVRSTWDAAGVRPSDIGSLQDFRTLAPFIDKGAIRRFRDEHGDTYGGLLCVEPSELTTIMSTSGTTGDATLFSKRWDEWLPEVRDLARHCWEMGIRPGDHAVYMALTIRGPLFEVWSHMGAVPILLDHSPTELGRFCALSLEHRPTGMFLLSSPLIVALEAMSGRVDLKDVFASYEGVVYGGEPLGDRARGLLEEWGIDLFNHTSNCDVGFANECRERDGNHVWEDLAFVEHLDLADPARRAPDRARGELVATALEDRSAPLIRYRSGDVVEYTSELCGCGRTHGRIWPLGRAGDEVRVAGRSILPFDVFPAVESVPETSAGLFQIIKRAYETDLLELRVGYRTADGVGSLVELRSRIEEAVLEHLDLQSRIELVANDELLRLGPPHKIPRTATQ